MPPETKTAERTKVRKMTDEELIAIAGGGLLIAGTVMGRKRRKIALEKGGNKFVITLIVLGGGILHNIDRWCETATPGDLPSIGTDIVIPVKLKHFTTRGGASMSKLEFGPGSDGEDF